MNKQTLLFICVAVSFTLRGQWNPNPAVNNAVCTSAYDQVNCRMASDTKGGAIITWEDYRNDPAQANGDIFVQRINTSGVVMWALNGVGACTDTANQVQPAIVEDGVGGAYIGWYDHRNTKRNLYVQRIDSSGNLLWTSNGIAIAPRNSDQKSPKLLNDGSNGVIIVWQDSISGNYDIYAQRMDGNGNQLWGSGGVAVCNAFGAQINPKAVITPGGDVFITWQDKRNGSDYDIYVQKLNLSGVAQWAANGVGICLVADTQSNPRIALDNAGGAVVAWQDKRNGVDYNLYAQRINPSGATQWSTNGALVTGAAGNQTAVDITSENLTNGVIMAWKDNRSGANNYDVYAQMLSLGGVAQWTANGLGIVTIASNQLSPNITGDGAGGAIIAFQDSSGGTWDIRAQRVTSAGALAWSTPTGVDIGTAANNQQNHRNISDGFGGNIFAFEDKRNGTDFDIYAYKVTSGGTVASVMNLSSAIQKAVQVYPNPSSGAFNFKIPGAAAGFKISVYDALGNEMWSDFSSASLYHLSSPGPAGIYYYTIQAGNSRYSGKLTVEN